MRWMSELQDFQKHWKTGKFLFHGENGFLKNAGLIVFKPQTSLTKMTARNVRRYHVKCLKLMFLQAKLVFFPENHDFRLENLELWQNIQDLPQIQDFRPKILEILR